MENIERIERLVVFQNLFNREKEIKELYSEEEKKLEKVRIENESLDSIQADMNVNLQEMNKKINEEVIKRDEINKRINSLNEGKDKIKIARQIKSWEKEMEKQQQELSLIQAQIDYDTSNMLSLIMRWTRIKVK